MMKRHWIVCAAALMLSAAAGMTAAASEEAENVHAFSIDMTDNNNEAWEKIAMTNDDMVKTGLNIRDRASADGLVIACLYRGGAVEVVHKDEQWTEVEVGDVTGFIKNEYLTYGTEAKGLAEHYGVYGVEASWNDVKVFEQPDANAVIIHSAEAGETFELIENQGHWQKIKFEDMEAYVSIEDVFPVILVDDLLIVDEPYSTSDDTYEEASYSEDTSYSDSSSSSSDSSSAGSSSGSSSAGSSSGSSSAGSSSGSTSAGSSSGGSSSGSSSSSGTDNTYTEPDTSGDDDDSDDAGYDDEIYTDDTVVDTEDASADDAGEEVEEVEDAEEYVDNSAAAPEETYTDDSWSGETYTDDTYTEEYVEETEPADSGSSSYSASDLDLMAAIIYCEAGNQSYEGQVAVGAVVMNRVNSSSFPNTISEVIYQSGQFTPASSGSLASALANGVPSTCYDAASAAMAGENPVGSALYFNGGSGSGMQIGDHQFY